MDNPINLNRQVTNLGKLFVQYRELLDRSKSEDFEIQVKKEFMRIVRLDQTLNKFNAKSLLILIKVNQSLGILAGHRFGYMIDVKDILIPKNKNDE